MKPIQRYFARLVFLLALSSITAQAVPLPEICYDKVEGGQFCTTDGLGWVQVYIYNAGWCGPCNQEMKELSAAYPEFSIQPVVFVSLSGEGWTRGAKPDATFLAEWQAKHRIPFIVAGKFRDFGKAFNSPGSIPFAVIIGKDGTVVKSGFLPAHEITAKVRELVDSWWFN